MEDGSSPLTPEEVRTQAKKTIAHYAPPRQLVIIAELPLTRWARSCAVASRSSCARLWGADSFESSTSELSMPRRATRWRTNGSAQCLFVHLFVDARVQRTKSSKSIRRTGILDRSASSVRRG